MLREETRIVPEYLDFGGIKCACTTTIRLVAKSFSVPAVGALTVESKLEKYTNQLLRYIRTELDALPSPVVKERIDPLWGKVYDHISLGSFGDELPDRGELYNDGQVALTLQDGLTAVTLEDGITPVTVESGRIVKDVESFGIGPILTKHVITTVASASVSYIETLVDKESGTPSPVQKTYTITASAPAANGVDSFGNFVEVNRVEYNIWLATRMAASGLPQSRANALYWVNTERSPVLWPAVLINWQFLISLDQSTNYWHKYLHYTLKSANTGDVKVEYRKWWQLAQPDEVTPQEMLGTKIVIPRVWNPDISIEPCLHGEFVIDEPMGAGLENEMNGPPNFGYRTVTYTVPATNVEDWHEQVVKLDITPVLGGFLCEERIVHKPQSSVEGSVVDVGPYDPSFFVFDNYP